jgi:cell division protein FtsZ
VGESEETKGGRMEEAVDEALTSPLLGKVDLAGAKGALIRVVGGPDMTIEEAAEAAEMISEKLKPDSRLIWGCSVEPEMQGRVKILVIITGARSQYVLLRDGTESVVQNAETDYRGAVNVPPRISQDEDLAMFAR